MQEDLREILDSHKVEPLSGPIQKAVDNIVAKYK